MESWAWGRRWLLTGLVFVALLFGMAFCGQAHADIWIEAITENVTFSQSVLDSLGRYYAMPESIMVTVRAMDGTQQSDSRYVVAADQVTADNDDSSLVFTDQWQDIDGDGADSVYEVTVRTFVSHNSVKLWEQRKLNVHVNPIRANIVEVASNLTTDGADGLLDVDVRAWNTTTAGRDSIILAAIRAIAALPAVAAGGVGGLPVLGSFNGTLNINSDGYVYASTDADTGTAGIKTKLTTIADSVLNAITATNKANFKATGFSTLTASDNIGINWADVSNPTTALDLSGTTIRSTDSALIVNIKDTDTITVSTSGGISAAGVDAIWDELVKTVGGEAYSMTARIALGSMVHPVINVTADSATNTTTRFRVLYGVGNSYSNKSFVGSLAVFGDTASGDFTVLGGQARRILAWEGEYGGFNTFMTIDRPLSADSAGEASADYIPGAGLNFAIVSAGADSLFFGTATVGLTSDSVRDIMGDSTTAWKDSVLNAITDVGKLGIAASAGDTIRAHAPHASNWGGTGASSINADTVRDIIGDSTTAWKYVDKGITDTIRDIFGDSTTAWKDSTLDNLADAGKLGKAGDWADTGLVHAPHGDNFATAGGAATIPDSLLQVANDLDSLLIMAREFIDDAPHSANYGATGSSGSGGKAITIYVIDTSGIDDTLPNVVVYIHDDAETATEGSGITLNPGCITFGLDASTKYQPIVRANGYIFPDTSFTTTSGVTAQTVVLSGYDFTVTATPSSHQTLLYGNCLLQTGELANCRVEITLSGAMAMYTSTNIYTPGRVIAYADASGDWSTTIVGTDSLSTYLPSGTGNATYCVRYFHSSLQTAGAVFEACNLTIPANGSSTNLRNILAQ